MPKVSIGMPVMDGERYLPAAIDAIRAQTFTDFEVLISDNASTDRTPEIAERVCKEDRRFRYYRHSRNVGAAGNFNYVFHNTSGKYFRWAAHDDLVRAEYLAACVNRLDASREAVLVYPQTMRIDADGHELGMYQAATRLVTGMRASERLSALIGPGSLEASLIHMCFPVFGLIRRSALKGTSLIANMPRSDMLLLVELALKGPFVPIEEALFLRREHDKGSVIAAERKASGPELERLLAAWFDPNRGKHFPATVTRLGWNYGRAILRTSMPAGEKLKSLGLLAGWTGRHFRTIGGEIKIVVRETLSAS